MLSTDRGQRPSSPRVGGDQGCRRPPRSLTLIGLVLACGWLLGALGCTGNMAPVSGPGGVSVSTARAGGYYVVQPGDTLYSIAWRNGVDHRGLARWNRIDPPYLIHPGQRLRLSVPGPKPSSSARQSVVRAERPAPAPKPTPRPPVSAPAPVATVGASPAWLWPAAGAVTRRFAADAQGKQGIEVSGRFGEPVTAAAAGRVVYAGNGLRGYGNLIIVKHNTRYLTAYGYNNELLVKEGDQVKAGQKIATMGMSSSRQPTLHFELRRDGKPVDPVGYLPAR